MRLLMLRSMKAPQRSLIVVFFGMLCASHTQAALIAYDGFDYTVGDSINSSNGGTGWSSAWTSTAAATIYTPSTALNYSGGSIAINGDNKTVLLGEDASPIVDRSFAEQTGTVYFSFLFRYDDNETLGSLDNSDFIHFMLNNDATTTNSGGIGKLGTTDIRLGSRIGGSNGGSTASSGTNMAPDTTYFLVGKISKATLTNYDTIELFINPLSSIEPEEADVLDSADSGMSSISHFTIRTTNIEADDEFIFDDLRIGTSFGDVVPEPSACGLALAGAGFLLARRRRKV